MIKHVCPIGFAFLLLAQNPALAHDFWLEPPTFFPNPGSTTPLRLYVGHELGEAKELPYQKMPTLRLDLLSAGKTGKILRSKEGATPMAQVRVTKPGSYYVVMNRDFRLISLEPEKFTSYLKHEGLEHIVEQRKKLGEHNKPGRERYGRFLKCLLQVGKQDDGGWKQLSKQRLEIVPLANPAIKKAGDTLRFRVLFEGKPLPQAPVFAYHQHDGKVSSQAMHTAKNGEATVRLNESGMWLIRLVHMQRCDQRDDADWESYWGAFSFGVR